MEDSYIDEGDWILSLVADDALRLDQLIAAQEEHSTRFVDVTACETDTFIEKNKAKSTVYKTKSDLKILADWKQSVHEDRDIEHSPASELDQLLARFVLALRKKDGAEYEPSTLTSIQNSIDRHLRDKKVPFSVKRVATFQHSNRVLEAKRKSLKEMGKGNKRLRSDPLSREEITRLQERGLIGADNPESLLYTIWLNNGICFGLRGRQDHVDLLWGDLELKKTTTDNREYLEFNERRTKTRSGAGVKDYRKVSPKMFQQKGNVFRPVDAYKKYRDHRPPDLLTPESRFYLQNLSKPSSDVWFSHQPVGKDKLGKMMNVLAEKGGLEGRKTNHSTRKTFATTLVHAGRAPTEVAHLAGWKNVQTVNEYSVPSIEQQATSSDIIASVMIPQQTVETPLVTYSLQDNTENIGELTTSTCTNEMSYKNRQSSSSNPFAVLCGANIHGGAFNITVYSGNKKQISLSQEN